MLHVLSAAHNVFRLPAWALGLIAVAFLGLGYFLQIETNKGHAREAAALAAGPPAVIVLAKAGQADDTTGVNEVVVEAQLLWDYSYDLWYEKEIGTDYVAMYPLVSADGTKANTVLGVAIFEAEDSNFSTITPELAEAWLVSEGQFGPVMNLNGEVRGMGQWDDLIADSFADLNLTMPDDIFVVWPYVEGRDVALAPPAEGAMTMFGFISKIAGAFGLLALAKLVFRKKPETRPEAPDVTLPPISPEIEAAPQRTAAPLWKQRSGLVEEDDYAPEPARIEPVQFEEPAFETGAPKTKRSTFGIRKVLIGIVGGMFLLGLASTVTDLVGKSSASNVAETQTIEEFVAESAAAAIVPDADPNRHWTDIDVAPIAEWFVAKFFLAVAGDVDAQMLFGGMLLGLFVAMFALRWYFIVRRVLRPKTTARFDSMGIN